MKKRAYLLPILLGLVSCHGILPASSMSPSLESASSASDSHEFGLNSAKDAFESIKEVDPVSGFHLDEYEEAPSVKKRSINPQDYDDTHTITKDDVSECNVLTYVTDLGSTVNDIILSWKDNVLGWINDAETMEDFAAKHPNCQLGVYQGGQIYFTQDILSPTEHKMTEIDGSVVTMANSLGYRRHLFIADNEYTFYFSFLKTNFQARYQSYPIDYFDTYIHVKYDGDDLSELSCGLFDGTNRRYMLMEKEDDRVFYISYAHYPQTYWNQLTTLWTTSFQDGLAITCDFEHRPNGRFEPIPLLNNDTRNVFWSMQINDCHGHEYKAFPWVGGVSLTAATVKGWDEMYFDDDFTDHSLGFLQYNAKGLKVGDTIYEFGDPISDEIPYPGCQNVYSSPSGYAPSVPVFGISTDRYLNDTMEDIWKDPLANYDLSLQGTDAFLSFINQYTIGQISSVEYVNQVSSEKHINLFLTRSIHDLISGLGKCSKEIRGIISKGEETTDLFGPYSIFVCNMSGKEVLAVDSSTYSGCVVLESEEPLEIYFLDSVGDRVKFTYILNNGYRMENISCCNIPEPGRYVFEIDFENRIITCTEAKAYGPEMNKITDVVVWYGPEGVIQDYIENLEGDISQGELSLDICRGDAMTFYDKDAKEVDFIYIDEDGVSNEVNGTYSFEKRGSYIFEVDFNERIVTCIYFEAIEEMEA